MRDLLSRVVSSGQGKDEGIREEERDEEDGDDKEEEEAEGALERGSTVFIVGTTDDVLDGG